MPTVMRSLGAMDWAWASTPAPAPRKILRVIGMIPSQSPGSRARPVGLERLLGAFKLLIDYGAELRDRLRSSELDSID